MSAAQGLDVEECKDLLAFKDLEGWDVACSSQISLPGQMNSLGQCDQMYWEMMIFGHFVLASSIYPNAGKLQQRKKEVQYEPLMILQKMQAGEFILMVWIL
jgi:hypothetical protein